MTEHMVMSLASIGLLAIFCQWIAWWLKLPAILFLLFAGILAGPVTGYLDPNALFGDLLFPIVSLSVAVILFEGSMTLKLDQIRGLERVVQNLISVGLLVTWVVIALASHWLIGFSWELSFLFSALTVVTGPTVIIPMLRTVRPNSRIANILRWEGIVIDPVGALLAVLVFEFIISGKGGTALGHTFFTFGKIIAVGVVFGVGVGYALGVALRKHWLPEYLHNLATLTLLFAVFAISNLLQEESGLLTVTVMGFWLANMKGVHIEEILDFKENLSVLLISGLFIILAARVEFAQFQALGWSALGVFLAVQLVARPLKVLVSTWGSSLTWQERALLGWIAPRGIVAAAVAALFAIRLEAAEFEGADLLVPLTFLVIIGTVLLQSATARAIANWLGVSEPEPRGFLVIGANRVARTIAKALHEKGFRCLLADSSWENVRSARMDGLPVFYGNPISAHADRNLDLIGVGSLLALSPQDDLNVLASLRYRGEFGFNAIYTLPKGGEKNNDAKHRSAAQHRGHILFGEQISYQKLASLLSKGAEIRSTPLTENFDYAAYREQHGKNAIPLFALDQKERLRVFVVGNTLKPVAGWVILSLIQAKAEQNGSTPTPKSA